MTKKQLETIKNLIKDGCSFKITSVGGGLSDTLEYSLNSDQIKLINSRGKIDLILKNIQLELKYAIEPNLKRKGRKIIITKL